MYIEENEQIEQKEEHKKKIKNKILHKSVVRKWPRLTSHT